MRKQNPKPSPVHRVAAFGAHEASNRAFEDRGFFSRISIDNSRWASPVEKSSRATMARKLRLEYPGAIIIYHLMNRGDRHEPIFSDGTDRKSFLETLGRACGKTDWQVPSRGGCGEETTMMLAWIAQRLRMGSKSHLAHLRTDTLRHLADTLQARSPAHTTGRFVRSSHWPPGLYA